VSNRIKNILNDLLKYMKLYEWQVKFYVQLKFHRHTLYTSVLGSAFCFTTSQHCRASSYLLERMLVAQEAGPDAQKPACTVWPAIEPHKHTHMQYWHVVWHSSQTKFLLIPTDITYSAQSKQNIYKQHIFTEEMVSLLSKINLQTSVSSCLFVGEGAVILCWYW
jgi:hypothetical protein